jgi:2-polyprenyl-3-methyl-5-hydroxy-6-metoxy-1,4-benzoquinol methylase
MKQEWAKFLCDPIDKTDLYIYKIFEKDGEDIISGVLRSKSGHRYNIEKGVPVLISKTTQKVNTVDSFNYEWNTFDFNYGKKGWLQDIVKPVVGGVDFFKNKTIVDCGAGSGRQSLWMAENGAKFIFSIELSDSVTSIVKKVINKFRHKIFVIKADIAHIPINKKVNIDLAYCVNVIQHTENPLKTTLEISKLLNRKSYFIYNIYLEKGRKNFLKILEIVRKFTKLTPKVILKYLSLLITVFCYFISTIPIIGIWFKKSMPIKHGFKETWLSVYDILGPHKYQKFYTEDELNQILKNVNLKVCKRSRYAMLLKIG